MSIHGKFSIRKIPRRTDELSYVADVELRIDELEDFQVPESIFYYVGISFRDCRWTSLDNIDTWRSSAAFGAVCAARHLTKIWKEQYEISFLSIDGHYGDTSPSIVAFASYMAVFNAFGIPEKARAWLDEDKGVFCFER